MAYETIRRLGRGGMGVVDLALGPDGREVALKRLSLHGTPEELEKARQRIRREAEVLRQLAHPAIVELLDVFDDGDDLVLVMDYLPGGNLAQKVTADGPLTADQIAELGDRLLDGLAAAHRQGVVHRDIKPANVLFDAEGQAKLADFGAAIHRDATPGLTASEMVVGTPGFMSPEQARGDAATAASDVFALGATLAFAATGEGPFGTADPRVLMLRAAAGRTEKLPRTLPTDLRRRLDAMLDKDPNRRPTAAAARGGPAGTHPRTAARVVPRGNRRRLAAGLGATVLVMGGLVAVLASRDGNGGALPAPTRPATSITAPCRDTEYQGCGQPPAPNTDGKVCLDHFADYDGDRTNGCEAEPDDHTDGDELINEGRANLVPDDDVDEWSLPVADRFNPRADGKVTVTLTAPAGVSQTVTVRSESGTVLAEGASADGRTVTLVIKEPGGFFTNDAQTLTIVVASVGTDRSAEHYVLTESGDF